MGGLLNPLMRDTIILPNNLTWKHWLCAGLGSGWLPAMPGTWGTLAALLPAWLLLHWFGLAGLMLASVVLLGAGCRLCADILAGKQDKDPGWIVIDEWVGLWLCLALALVIAGDSWCLWLLSFAAFRLFDIWKPGPVAWCERNGPAWWTIMADDVMAGLLGGLLVALLLRLFTC